MPRFSHSLLAGSRIRLRRFVVAGGVLVGAAFAAMPVAGQDTTRVDQATFSGTWTGRRPLPRTRQFQTYQLELTETGIAVAGTVTRLVDDRAQEVIAVGGERRDNRVRLADRRDTFLLVGTLKGDRIRARVTREATGYGSGGEQASNRPGAGDDYEFRRLP